jgi:hypothetical protein
MHQPTVPADMPDQFYGMGWYIGALDGMPAVYHGGENGNFSTYLIMVPKAKLGIAVMINVNGLPVNDAVRQIAEGVMEAVMGNQPQPYKTPEMLPKVIGSVMVPVMVSILWIAWMVYRFIRRRKYGLPARRNLLWNLWVVILPLIVDLGLLWILLFGIPMLWGLPLSGMAEMFPDIFMLVAVSAVALAGWGAARTALTLRLAKAQPKVAA